MSKKLDHSLVKLGDWFDRQKRVLPWRSEPTLYRVWISEIMLQQTQVVTVIPYFEKFMGRFPCLKDLATAPESEVMKYWAGLGYYSRARNLHKGAKHLYENGFPKDRDGWLAVPGVGPYTAGAILSIALDQPIPILDGNVERVLSRIYRVSGGAEAKPALWKYSEKWVKRADTLGVRPSNLNQALMEIGALICSPKKPKCLLCPLQSSCQAFSKKDMESFPEKKKRVKWKKVEEEVHCLMNSKNEVLLRLREKGEWRAGLWDFPESAPTQTKAKSKSPPKLLGEVESRHIVTNHKITRKTKIWKVAQKKPSQNQRWVPLAFGDSVFEDVPVGSAFQKTLKQIHSYLQKLSDSQ